MTPTASVVVPTYRRADRLAGCLTALTRLDYPPSRLQVVVVDDGSPTPMETVTAPFRDRLDLAVHRQDNAGPATARNTGARVADGDLLAFTDDDCAPRPGWLAALAERFVAEPDAMVGGVTVNGVAGNLFSEASQQLVTYICDYFGQPGRRPFLASNNMAMSAATFRDLGGFDTSYPRPGGEDRELCDRWLREGGTIRRTPAAVLDHFHHLGARSFWRQHTAYGRGAYHFHAQRAAAAGDGLRVEPLAFYTGLVSSPFASEPPLRAAAVAALLVLAQVANAAGFAAERVSAGRAGSLASSQRR
jgi:GT2 family glycosyltransferase